MSQVLRTLGAFIRLTRLYVAPITASLAFSGALATGAALDSRDLMYLSLLGLTAHLFGFGLNDIVDLSIDRRHPQRRRTSPLVTGELSLLAAHLLTWPQLPLTLLLLSLSTPVPTTPPILLTGALSGLSCIAYNLWSKRGPVPPWVAEFSLGGCVACFLLAGALTQQPRLDGAVWVLAATAWLQLVLTNSLSSGLKDLDADAQVGARSFVIWMGARVPDGDPHARLTLPRALWAYGGGLQLLIALASPGILLLTRPPLAPGLLMALVTASLVLHMAAAYHLYLILSSTSFAQLYRREPLFNALLNYAGVMVALTPLSPAYFGVQAVFVLLLSAYRLRKHLAYQP